MLCGPATFTLHTFFSLSSVTLLLSVSWLDFLLWLSYFWSFLSALGTLHFFSWLRFNWKKDIVFRHMFTFWHSFHSWCCCVITGIVVVVVDPVVDIDKLWYSILFYCHWNTLLLTFHTQNYCVYIITFFKYLLSYSTCKITKPNERIV